MPSLPNKSRRRRQAIPIKKIALDHVWDRTLDYLALVPIDISNKAAAMAETSAPEAPSPSSSTSSGKPSAQQLTFLDLPFETHRCIFSYAHSTDLIALSLVSKQFRVLAAEQLYRTFHIVFPDDDDPSNDSPIDGLASGLDTFVTSEYDYASHLREMTLETLSGGEKGERAYRHYLYDVSCGKFMNTLLLLTLRKAKALETFKWDIRVELSREVFRALHQIGALQNLHLRMQAGASIYQLPPALPFNTSHTPTPPLINISLPPPPPPPNSSPFTSTVNSFPAASKASSSLHKHAAKKILPLIKSAPPTLSGFKNLKSLSILDMDTLDYIDEIRTCIRNSSSTINSLQLSFSESLANKSRRPPPDPQSDDDSDQEDEFGNVVMQPGPPPPNPSAGASDPNSASKAFNAQEERKRQEAVLGRIFGVEPVILKPKAVVPSPKSDTKDKKTALTDKDFLRTKEESFIKNLAPVAQALMRHVEVGSESSTVAKETLALIDKAVKLYLDVPQTSKAGSSTTKETPPSSVASTIVGEEAAAEPSDGPGLFDSTEKKKKTPTTEIGVSNPDDIDIEEPEGKELVIEDGPQGDDVIDTQEPETDIEVEAESKEDETPATIVPTLTLTPAQISSVEELTKEREETTLTALNISKERDELAQSVAVLKDKLTNEGINSSQGLAMLEATTKEAERVAQRALEVEKNARELCDKIDHLHSLALGQTSKKSATSGDAKKDLDMSTYIRNTRGLMLSYLAIYLVPLKSSVLSRAIDFSVLRSITLLNVGPQNPLWNYLTRENQNNGPLPLSKIHTDNVTLPFLVFVAQLQNVDELFLLERTLKAKVESTAVKSTVTMEQIRKLILKRHSHSLRIFMLRNDAGVEWDLNIKTVLLLCQRAKKLEELACSFGAKVMHTLLQFIPGLTSLRALHTLQFRNDDACMWVMRELRKFTVDNISHHPEMNLQYLALDAAVDRLVRRKPTPPTSKDIKGKGKEVRKKGKSNNTKTLAEHVVSTSGPVVGPWSSTTSTTSPITLPWNDGMASSAGPTMLSDLMGETDDEDEDREDDGWVRKMGLRIEVVEGLKFCDVVGVRIFEKDVLGGRL